MASILRIRGRILINGNIAMLSLVLLCVVGFVFVSNLSVLIYETVLSVRIREFSGQYESIIDFIFSVVLILFAFGIYSVLKLGTDRFFLRRAQKKGASARDFFYYCHPLRGVGAVGFMLKLTLVKTAALILTLTPFALSLCLVFYLLNNGVSAVVLLIMLVGCVAFFISGVIFFKSITDSLFLAKYYFLEGKYLTFLHIIGSSIRSMKDKTNLLRKIRAGFYGWFLLCILILPVGYVWSYYNQTLAVASQNFMND